MINEKDILDAIAECQGVRNPSASTCIKLASYYTILDKIKKESENDDIPDYSYYVPNTIEDQTVSYESKSEFFQIANGQNIDRVWNVIDDLMNALQILNPKLYKNVLRKLEGD